MSNAVATLSLALAGHYRVERELGVGGMATVYLAEDLKHHRQVAIKVLREDLAASLGSERFVREISIAAGLTHPHILPLHDSGEAGGRLFYVMPFVDGPTLRQKLMRQGELPIAEAVRILRDVADAMAYAHKRGVVHRDIKPENVMLSERHALVTDFGVAKAVSEATGRNTLTTAGVALGTPTYMAPEQATADPHMDHRADIYAFGVLAYELIAGRPPFAGGSPQEVLAAHVTRAAEPVTTHRVAVPPVLAALIMKCLEKKPADRWQGADELMAQLEAVLTPSGGMTPTNTQPLTGVTAAAAPVGGSRWARVGMVATGLVAVAAGGWYAMNRTSALVPGRVAVLSFENKTGDATLDDRGARLAEAMIEAIGREGVGEPVAAATIRDLGKTGGDPAALARSVSQRTGAELVIRGAYYKAQAGVEVRVEVLRMPAQEQRFAFSTVGRADADSLLAAVTQRGLVALTLEKEWGPGVSWQGEYLPVNMTTIREFLRSTELEAQQDTAWFAAARAAVTADSMWVYPAIAAMRIDMARTGYSSGAARALTQLETIERRGGLTQGDRERLGGARGLFGGDWEAYYQSVKRTFARRPTEYGAELASAAFYTMRFQEAVDLRNFLDTPGFWTVPARRNVQHHITVAYSMHLLGRYDEEAALGRHMRAEFPNLQVVGFNHEMRAAIGRGDVVGARRSVDEFEIRGRALGDFTSSRALVAGWELAGHGHTIAAREMYQRAERTLQAILARGDTSASVLQELASAYWYQDKHDDLRGLLPLLLAAGDSSNYHLWSGGIAAKSGDRRTALEAQRALLRMRVDSPFFRADPIMNAVYLAIYLGDHLRAMELLREARTTGYAKPYVYHLDTDFIPLRGTPAFEEFIRPRK